MAALLVAFGHVTLVPSGGWVGMPLFFVLSGYLITHLLATENAATGSIDRMAFYGRRVARLGPAMAVLLVIVGVTGAASGASFWTSVAYLKNWQMVLANTTDATSHLWSLAIEEQFYLVWPFVIALIPRRRALWLTITLAIAATALRFATTGDRAYYGTDTRADALLLGAALALWGGRLPRWAGLVGLLGLLALSMVPAHDRGFWLGPGLTLGVIGSFLVVGARGLGLAWLAPLGLVSYGFYLYHWPIAQVTREAPFGNVLGIALAIACATVSYIALERPIIQASRLSRSATR